MKTEYRLNPPVNFRLSGPTKLVSCALGSGGCPGVGWLQGKTLTWKSRKHKIAELGTRQFFRDNVTMFSGHKFFFFLQYYCICLATPSRHIDLNIFRIFFVPEALLRCRVVVVTKLKNCRVPSSDFKINLCLLSRRKSGWRCMAGWITPTPGPIWVQY